MIREQIVGMVKNWKYLGCGNIRLTNVALFLANIPGFLRSFFLAITVLRRGPNFKNVCENMKYKEQKQIKFCVNTTH